MSIPPFFEPYKLEDALYVDGAFADNMPVNIARDMGFRKILSVDVSPPRPLESDKIKNSLEATWRAMSISIKNSHRPVKATVHIEAYKGAYNFDFEHADELIDVGRQAVIDNELKIKRAFYSWYHRI
jgi:NTE family protein